MKSHAMNDCEQFQRLSYEERKNFSMKNRICLKCVSSNKHVSKDCNRDKLECKIYQQKHATILHDPTRHEKKDTSQVKSACSQVCGRSQPARSCARILLLEVFHQDNPSAKVPTYAVLDDQSTDVFVTDSLLEQLGVEGHEVNLEINTITGINSVRTQKVNCLHIQDIDNLHKSIKVPFAYSQEKIPANQEDIATPENAIDVIRNTQAMCAAANLRLHKFASNSKVVLEATPAEDRSKDLKDLDLHHDTLPVQCSLGTYWCIESDTIGFRIELKDKPLTRRGILSTVCSVYDPLGIVAPVILVGKQLLQELCRDGIRWDDPVPSHIHSQWEKWRSELALLEEITITRCVKPPGFGEPVVIELHSFSDASDLGLGQVTYLRLVNNSNQVHVSFLMGKARVAPLKPMSTPRRELTTAAVISVNVTSMLSRELNYKDPVEVYYTDSMYTTSMTVQNHSSGTMSPAQTTQLTLPHEEQPPNDFRNMNCGLKARTSCGRTM